MSLDVECDSVLCMPLVVVTSQFLWGPFSTVVHRRLQVLRSLVTPVLVLLSCEREEDQLVSDGVTTLGFVSAGAIGGAYTAATGAP
ncbi:hypothetical protein Taro_054076 [Colocasia esculenta]|uniref:Uncharacterized protein n=1 Tax=Colocasia esculenta TaxID=4460 RepID=A0A843XQ00_COLES|nr:hypothetical protein [Colocasia esculenta]